MIKNRLKKVKAEVFGDEEENVVKIDLSEQKIGALLDEISQIGLGFSKKLILVTNSNFFETLKKRKSTAKKVSKKKDTESREEEVDELIKILDVLDEDTSVIFLIETDEIDKERALYKYIKDNGTIFELKELTKDEWPKYVRQYFAKREINITDDAVEELVKRVNGDLNSFNNESAKLLMYAEDNKIDLKVIEDLVPASLDDDAFKILNYLLEGKKDSALKVYRDLRTKNTEPMSLINLLISNLLFMLNVKIMAENGKSNEEMALRTGSSTGRIFMTMKNSRRLKRDVLESKIDALYELERSIKHSEVDRFVAFELFLINF